MRTHTHTHLHLRLREAHTNRIVSSTYLCLLPSSGPQNTVIKIIPFSMVIYCHNQLLSIVCKITLAGTTSNRTASMQPSPRLTGAAGRPGRSVLHSLASSSFHFLAKGN